MMTLAEIKGVKRLKVVSFIRDVNNLHKYKSKKIFNYFNSDKNSATKCFKRFEMAAIRVKFFFVA